jgi:hypothetical protein
LIAKELRRLRKLIGNDVALIVGGRAAGHYEGILDQINVLKIKNYDHFKEILENLGNERSEKIPA